MICQRTSNHLKPNSKAPWFGVIGLSGLGFKVLGYRALGFTAKSFVRSHIRILQHLGYVYMCMYIYVCMYVYTHIHIYIYICTCVHGHDIPGMCKEDLPHLFLTVVSREQGNMIPV